MIGAYSLTFRLAIMLCLLFRICLAKVAIGIRLVFHVADCAMVICLVFRDRELLFLRLAIVNCLSDCYWLFALV